MHLYGGISLLEQKLIKHVYKLDFLFLQLSDLCLKVAVHLLDDLPSRTFLGTLATVQ